MPKSPKASRSPRRPAGSRARAGQWQLVRVDQRPLRRKAASECSRELARVEKARAEWRRFDREDKPAFERWSSVRFGAQLTELRDLELALREKERLIDEVEIEYAWIGAPSFRAAYWSVMRRKNAPSPSRKGPPEEASQGSARDFKDFSAEEKRAVFEDFVQDFYDIDPEALPKQDYQRMYQEFEASVRKGGRKTRGGAKPAPAPAPDRPARPDDARIKEVYRLLVRRLHPDTRADSDAEISALWHEVQDAYQTGNRDRLEMLLALTDIRAKSTGEHTALFQMREVLGELRAAFQSLQKSLLEARKDPAWKFSRGARHEVVEGRLQRRFAANLAARRKRLREIETQIARWARPLKSRRTWVSELQVEFSF